MLGYRISMPSFLHGKTQLTTEEANQSRLVTANRWVIESGEHLVDIVTFRYQYYFSFGIFPFKRLKINQRKKILFKKKAQSQNLSNLHRNKLHLPLFSKFTKSNISHLNSISLLE